MNHRTQPSLSIWGTIVYAVLFFRYRIKSISKAPAELLLPACPALCSLILSLEQVQQSWTSHQHNGKQWIKNLLGLAASPCSTKAGSVPQHTHVNYLPQNDTTEPLSHTSNLSKPETQPCCHLLLQSARGQQPAEAARGKSSFLPFFPSSKGG